MTASQTQTQTLDAQEDDSIVVVSPLTERVFVVHPNGTYDEE